MKIISVACAIILLTGCKKPQTATVSKPQPNPETTNAPDVQARSPDLLATEELERTKIASYADFVKAAKQLNMRLTTGITHEEFDEKAGILIDAYSLIEDPPSQLMDTATSVLTMLKRTQNIWNMQDQVGIHDRQDIPTCLSGISKRLDAFLLAYSARKHALR